MKRISKLMIAVILLTTISSKLKAQVNKQDSLALVDLYDSTGGANWTNHTNWLTSAPVSSWFGVTVSGGRVNYISGQGNNLSGSIPSSLGNLTSLKQLDLSYNHLSGSIPSSLGSLTNLNLLIIGMNKLSGYIPYSFGNLANLYALDLSFNQLSGSIPTSLGTLSKLEGLDLHGNLLSSSIPSSLCKLTNLIHLKLAYNLFTETIPSSIGDLSKLEGLDLSHNMLSGNIPTSLGNLTNLTALYLYGNELSGTIPSSLKNLTNLAYFYLKNNKFTFAGMEGVATLAPGYLNGIPFNGYAPQAPIPLYNNNNTLSVSVGGTPSNNTFKWYKDSKLVATKVGDSTYTAIANGKYWVVATNSVATQLTLYSDTVKVDVIVPIKSISLQSKTTNGQVLLQWQTINELKTSLFIIQHSTDGVNFTDINTKEALGSGNNSYSLIDKLPTGNINYYRIQAIDKDGSLSYSNVALLTPYNSRLTTFTVVPNPVRDVLTLKGNHIALVQVIDNMGKVIITTTLQDATNPTLSVGGLAVGNYLLRLKTTTGQQQVVKFVKE